ncbi:CBS domain-containing protein [Candidatus Bathyarchaeota archaeon]|nr:CBS domain-containing protein [Candidatus Bathyarchaeota archaeon]
MPSPKVKYLMTEKSITVDVNKTIFDAAAFMSEETVGCLIVIDGGDLLG